MESNPSAPLISRVEQNQITSDPCKISVVVKSKISGHGVLASLELFQWEHKSN